jgi:hypothetical protein
MPRTGSTLLQEYLATALGVQNAGEFFALSKVRIRRAHQVSDTGYFPHDYQLTDYLDVKNISEYYYVNLDYDECQKRLAMIRDFESRHSGIVFKVFASRFMRDTRIDLKYFADNFNMVVLYRQNVFNSIISEFVCASLDTWHEFDKSKVPDLIERVSGVKIHIDENQFMKKLKEHIYLSMIARNINSYCDHARVLRFEDFDTDSVNNLNRIFNANLEYEPIVNKFIEEHEHHVENIDRLRTLYDMFRPY